MADIDEKTESPADQLERSTYEIIRNRLNAHAEELRLRMEKLNGMRRDVFGSIPTELIGNERISTANNCLPRDIVSIGDQFIFGYNVHIGLRTETLLTDVFAVYRSDGEHFHEEPLEFLNSGSFEHDFKQIYKYYKETTFHKFQVIGPYLYFVFKVGRSSSDIKSFKFLIEENSLKYIDNRSDHEVRYPAQHGFAWKRTHRDLHRAGNHPHISIDDRVFVETVGGDLTVKIEDNTDDGKGIYSEPVDDPDQTLDDAEVFFAIVGNLILLKIRPFKEENYRFLVFSEKTQSVTRLDSVGQGCVLLPEDHGLIFSNGFFLQSGEHKTFENELQGLLFERSIAAANGEDYLYVFYQPDTGQYVLLSYNMIEQKVQTPMLCNGFSFFDDGRLVCFRSDDSPQKHHSLQVWQTPFVGSKVATTEKTGSYLFKIGNREVVRAMSECSELINLISKDDDSYSDLYVDLVKKSGDVVDSYFWLGEEVTFNLAEIISKIRDASSAAVDEFDKVVRVRRNTQQQFDATSTDAKKVVSDCSVRPYRHINDFVESLAKLRETRGRIISLRELKYIELDAVEKLESLVADQAESRSHQCVQFLLNDKALQPYVERVEAQHAGIAGLETVVQANKLSDEISASSNELEMLIEIVSNLKIDDATHRTQIIDNISTIYANINKTRAGLKKKSKELMSVEGAAEFNSQLKLVSQAIVNYLDVCDSPQKCDEYLTKMMVQVEELEGRFSEFDEFIVQLAEKREEIYAAFDNKKLQITEARNRRATALMSSADRILTGIQSRVSGFDSVDEINSYFASDLMIEKVRDIIEKLQDLDESVKVDDIQSRLKTVREDTVRQLRDKNELFVDGKNVIQFGEHNFSVNIQQLDLTTVLKDGETYFHLSGTNYFEKVEDADFNATKDVWDQNLVSENKNVYRAEYLAFLVFEDARTASDEAVLQLSTLDEAGLIAHVQKFMAPRYAEGYIKGVHDHDAALILNNIVALTQELDLLKHSTAARVLANIFWDELESDTKLRLNAKLNSLAEAFAVFGKTTGRAKYIAEIAELIREFVEATGFSEHAMATPAANCLFDQLVIAKSFVASAAAVKLNTQMDEFLKRQEDIKGSQIAALRSKSLSAVDRFEVVRDWLASFAEHKQIEISPELLDEAASLKADHHKLKLKVIDANPVREVTGLLGDHPCIDAKSYRLNYNHFMDRLERFRVQTVPAFERFVHLKKELVDIRREELRLNEFKPRVLSSFVRNRLINDVYLPMVGANLAKQIGVVGENKRTDLMGLLLLISPPGYGKTTLMEYIANRLGITFVKINGPAIGHRVTSLDPVEAPNASAREEVEKLNLALEMGDNVMIYLDDIQHCNPEFLQKFISLCDATRRIEGVFRGKTRTYDLRGRKVCVVMAGNPYTESGEKFQIPDMLANRADTYNLGDVIGDSNDVFELSYLENCLTSNATLSKLQSRSREDIYAVVEMAQHPDGAPHSLSGNYSIEEINEFVNVMKKLLAIRDVILNVNREYIDSAAQADDYRTEPAFRMQGSYRDMNKIAERVVPILNDDELETLIISHYENQAQTLTTGAEANLLKFRELTGKLDEEQAYRWEDICKTYKRNQFLGSTDENDQVGQVIAQMSMFSDSLQNINTTIDRGIAKMTAEDPEGAETMQVVTLREVTRIVGELAKFNTTLDSIKTAYTEHAETISKLPRHLSEHKIEVVNKVPNAILNVLRNQFRVLQTWMEPILKLSENFPEGSGFVEASKSTEASYKRLLSKMELELEDDDEDEGSSH